MDSEEPDHDHRRQGVRRAGDDMRYWFALGLSLATTLTAVGVLWGALGGRLNLIEYRLGEIEKRVATYCCKP